MSCFAIVFLALIIVLANKKIIFLMA